MSLADFRATRRVIPIADAIAELPFLSDLDFGQEYTYAAIYDGGFYILQSRAGWYLEIEGDEYFTRDVALLEFVLWQWSEDGDHMIDLRAMIWG
jgi:hypothetical protein